MLLAGGAANEIRVEMQANYESGKVSTVTWGMIPDVKTPRLSWDSEACRDSRVQEADERMVKDGRKHLDGSIGGRFVLMYPSSMYVRVRCLLEHAKSIAR